MVGYQMRNNNNNNNNNDKCVSALFRDGLFLFSNRNSGDIFYNFSCLFFVFCGFFALLLFVVDSRSSFSVGSC